ETADEYFTHLKTFATDLTDAVEDELKPTKPWHQGRLQRDLLDRLKVLDDWIVVKRAPAATDTPASLHTEAGLPITIDGVYRIDDQPLPKLNGLAQWTLISSADGLLALWALGPSRVIEELDDSPAYPPIALNGGLPRTMLARKIMGLARA